MTSRTTQLLAVFVLGLASASVQAESAYATVTDNLCNTATYGNVTPVAKYSTYGGSRCSICHNANNRSIKMTPEWDWYQYKVPVEPPTDPVTYTYPHRANFCVVQGIIETPVTSMTLSRGATFNLKARGFSPRGKSTTIPISLLTYTWSFSDGRPPIVLNPVNNQVASVANVPLPTDLNIHSLTITLNTADSSGLPGGTDLPLDSETRVITISDDPITVDNDTYSIQSGHTLSVTSSTGVLQGDSGVGTLTASLVSTALHGTLNLSSNGGFSYTPTAGFVGDDTFTYTATNGVLTSPQATVTINVTSVAPTANADHFSVQAGIALPVATPGVLANDLGAGTLTAVLGTNVTHGSLALNANGSFNYTPTTGFTGNDSFTYVAQNVSGNSSLATVTLAVGSCTDKDKDGYSPEGGSCGPLDCDDKAPNKSPGLKEICNNGFDDDCNGKIDQADPGCTGADCIGTKLASQVRIDAATWSADKLTVSGSKATVGATVTVSKLDPVTLAATPLGTVVVAYNGSWKFEQAIAGSANAPCRIQATINGANGVKAVTGGTATCASQNGAPASCGL